MWWSPNALRRPQIYSRSQNRAFKGKKLQYAVIRGHVRRYAVIRGGHPMALGGLRYTLEVKIELLKAKKCNTW